MTDLVHPADRYIRNVSLLALITIGLLHIYSTHRSDRDVSCFTPSQFTESMIDYTRTICAAKTTYYLPVSRSNMPQDTLNRPHEKTLVKSNFLSWIAVEIAVCCFLYQAALLLTNSLRPTLALLYDESPATQKTTRYSCAGRLHVLLYVLVLLGSAAVWFCLGVHIRADVMETNKAKEQGRVNGLVFLCDFEIRQMARVHSHTVQCVRTRTDMENNLNLLNPYVCLLLGGLYLTHLTYLLLIGPILTRRAWPRGTLGQSELKDKCVTCYGFTDVYLASLMMTNEGSKKPGAAGKEVEKSEPSAPEAENMPMVEKKPEQLYPHMD